MSYAAVLASKFAFGGDAGLPLTPWPRTSGAVLTTAEWATLDAVTARILPGAREAAVVAFIDLQLATGAPLSFLRQPVTVTLGLFDSWATARFGGPFAGLPPARQDEGLAGLALGQLPVKNFPQQQVFRLLHGLTLEGFLSDPRHGGNRGQLGWASVRFGGPAEAHHGH